MAECDSPVLSLEQLVNVKAALAYLIQLFPGKPMVLVIGDLTKPGSVTSVSAQWADDIDTAQMVRLMESAICNITDESGFEQERGKFSNLKPN